MNQTQQQLQLHQQQQQQHHHPNFHQSSQVSTLPHQLQQPFQSLLSVSLSSMGEQTQPQPPLQTQINSQSQLQPPPQLSIHPETQPQTTIQTQSQIQSQPQPQPEPQTQTETQALPENPPQLQQSFTSQVVEGTTIIALPVEGTGMVALPQKPSSASKIPFRPRKTRKVSMEFSADNSENKAPQPLDGDDANPTPPTNSTAGNKKNSRGSKTTNAPAAVSAAVTGSTAGNNDNRIIVQPIRVIPRIVGKTLSCEGEIAAAIRHLRSVDPQLARVIDVHQPPSFDTFHPPFLALTKSILYQQLAFKAAASIYTRFVALCGGEAGVVPDAVLSLSVHQLRQIGVSARKASYLHDLASKYQKNILSDSSIIDMDDKSLFSMLTMVKGIGSWSVHMFMIFSLHRPDVLPVGDIGVRKGVQLLYGLEQLPRPSQMEQLCGKWKPYRSVGAWYMWRFAEAKGAQASAAAVAVGASPLQLLQQQQQQQAPQLQLQPQLQPQPQQQQPQLLDPISGIPSLE